MPNLDPATVKGFGDEWARFDQSVAPKGELSDLFASYFSIFPWSRLPQNAVGVDVGCGSGRWAKLVAPRVGQLFCVDASDQALSVAKRNLADLHNCNFIHASVDQMPIPDESMDFGYSLGVLHHVPDTRAAIQSCVQKLKPGAPFLVYLYYRFDNRAPWFTWIWRLSGVVRSVVSRMPHSIRYWASQIIAATVYWPLARTSWLFEKLGFNISQIPLSQYRFRSFYTMRTDALDRFGTRLEQRFTAKEICDFFAEAGLTDIKVSQGEPYWCVVGLKRGG